jgi:hypothetical protein
MTASTETIAYAGDVRIDTTTRLVTDNGKKYRKTTKTYTGPKKLVDRLQWKHFGSVKDPMAKTDVTEDIEFEFTTSYVKNKDEWRFNGLYLGWARKDNWTQREINCIVRSARPDLEYRKIYKRRLDTLIAETIEKMKTDEDKQREKDSEEALLNEPKKPVKINTAGLSLTDLLKQKTRQRTLDQTKGGTSAGITALLRNKQDKQSDKKCTIYVQNIPDEYIEADISAHLTEFEIRRTHMVRRPDRSGVMTPVGTAFIECYDEDETEKCIEFLNTCKWEHRVINAQHSKPKTKK